MLSQRSFYSVDVMVLQKKNVCILSCPKLQLPIRFSDILLQGKVTVSFGYPYQGNHIDDRLS